jgi:hypothetical protein
MCLYRERKSGCTVLMGIPEGTKPLRRRGHPLEDDIKLDLKDIGREFVDSTDVAQERCKLQTCVKTVMKFRFA